MVGFGEKFKGIMRAAGSEARKLGKLGQLKLDLVSAESTLSEAYKRLGKITASRLIDRAEGRVESSEASVRVALDGVSEARSRVDELKLEIEAVKE